MCFLFCCCLCTVCSLVSDALLLAFCNLALAFIADLTLSHCKTHMRFMALSGKLCSAFLLAPKTCWQDLHTFVLSGTIVSQCGHTLLGGMIEKSATHATGHIPFTEQEAKWPLSTTWTNNAHSRFRRVKWPTAAVISHTMVKAL